MSAIFQLVNQTVDYAGLFPPAALDLETVVTNYANYIDSKEVSMLARLIIPATRLTELGNFVTSSETKPGGMPWKISALVPPITQSDDHQDSAAFEDAIRSIKEFNSTYSQIACVDAIETRISSKSTLLETIEKLPTGIRPFLEVPHDQLDLISDLADAVDRIQPKEVFAKIRTGGVRPELIPSAELVASFISSCANRSLGFKATAGLHHPVRAERNLTYAEDSPQAVMHGFINVFVASMIAFEHKLPATVIEEILGETDPGKFLFEPDQCGWMDHVVTKHRIEEIRKSGIISFGSCSFEEPTAEIQDLPNITHQSVFAN